jgi:hypothetical protein
MDDLRKKKIDDIVSILNAQSPPEVEQKNCSVILWFSIFSPVIFPALGYALGSTMLNQGDWLGMSIIVPTLIGLIIGVLISFILMIVAFKMDIRHKEASLVTGIPAALIILYALKETLG